MEEHSFKIHLYDCIFRCVNTYIIYFVLAKKKNLVLIAILVVMFNHKQNMIDNMICFVFTKFILKSVQT